MRSNRNQSANSSVAEREMEDAPPGFAYRPGRGLVKQIGGPPQVSPELGNTTQDQRNRAPVDWAGTFGSNAQRPAINPPQPHTTAAPSVAWNAGVSPAVAHSEPTPQANPTSIQSQYGTASVHAAQAPAPDWQDQILAKYPNVGVAGSPENKAFTDSFNQHGAPELGMADADHLFGNTATSTNPIARSGETQGPNFVPGMVNESRYDGPNEAPPTGGYATPPPQATQNTTTIAPQAPPAPATPQIAWNANPSPGTAHNDINGGVSTQRDEFGHEIPAWKGDFNSAVSNGINYGVNALGTAANAYTNLGRAPIGALAGQIDQNVSGGPTIARGLAALGGVQPPKPKPKAAPQIDAYANN